MSLVEIALKKLQTSGRPVTEPPHKHTQPVHPAAPAERGTDATDVDASGAADTALLAAPRMQVKLDRVALRAQGLLPPESQERLLTRQYRHIKRPLVASALGRGTEALERGKVIMVASAMPGEGKTFTSINLALSLALEKDVSIVLVDGDVGKPHLSQVFGVADQPGLMDVLRDDSLDVESLILPTDVAGLSILPLGSRTDTATELLASPVMDRTMDRLIARKPRIVVIDSPPLLLTNESRVLAQAAGQIVLVVRAGSTPQQAVLDAVGLLGENKAIGLVLNQTTDEPKSGYYYGYGDAPQSESPSAA